MADSRFFVDVFGDIVDSMRATGTITDSVEASGTYTLTTVNTFSAFDSISILDVDYLISAATGTTITISAATGLDFTGETWKDLAPYYMYGHPMEIASRLTGKDKDPKDKWGKYPLIALFQDFTEEHGNELTIDYTLPFSILIVDRTSKTYNSEERYENVFKPILYTLYDSLLVAIAKSPYIFENDPLKLEHSKIDRLYWGVVGITGNEGLKFNDVLDAIEVNFDGVDIIKNNYTCP